MRYNAMKGGHCWNCRIQIAFGALCVDCVRMAVVTLVSTGLSAGVALVVRWLWR